MTLLTRAKYVGGKVVYPVGTGFLWKDLISYNVGDVVLLDRVFAETYDYGEPDVLDVDHAINQRGIPIDLGFCETLKRIYDQHTYACIERMSSDEVTDGEIDEESVRSVPKMRAWLRSQGFQVPTLEKKALEELFRDPSQFYCDDVDDKTTVRVIEALKLRQEIAKTGKGKLVKATLTCSEDGRIRNSTVYYGGHTGRWGGRGFQPHNFFRGVKEVNVEALSRQDLTYREVQDEAQRVKCTVGEVLGTLVRGVICAQSGCTLGIIDYANVEGRCAAWIAGVDDMLHAFSDWKRDIYKDMAAKVYGCTVDEVTSSMRFVGKQIILGCQYGMGATKFEATCEMYGTKLSDVGTTGKICVDTYRKTYPRIRELWRNVEAAAKDAIISGSTNAAGRCIFHRRNGHLHIQLPSGRNLVYRNARIEDRVPGYCQLLGIANVFVPTIVFDHYRGYESTLYGGLLVENICQAICRDLLATALIDLNNAGLNPVMHVHDEAVCENEGRLEQQALIMTTGPQWAGGFPIGVEGFTSPRYTKYPFKTAQHIRALNGVIS